MDEELRTLVLDMFKADTAYGGAAFYSDEAWRAAYLALQRHVDYREATTVHDPEMYLLEEERV